MAYEELIAAADTHRQKIVEGLRFVASEPQTQQALCPPFMVVSQLIGELLDVLEHAEVFQNATNTAVFPPDQSGKIRSLFKLVEACVAGIPESALWTEYATSDDAWRRVRARAKELLGECNWRGEPDPESYAYSDPATGARVVPRLPSSREYP